MPTFNWAFQYQTIVLEILTQPSHYKRAENNLQADENGPHHLNQGSGLFLLQYTYTFIVYSRDEETY